MSTFVSFLLIAGLFVFAYLGILFLAQRKILFPSPPAPARPYRGTGQLLELALPAGPIDALYLAPASGDAGPAPLLIFFHGNGELIDYWPDLFDAPRSWGWAVLLVEFPGYGASAGAPSEASLNAAAAAAYDWARSDPRIDPARIVPYGRSLGGGPAARLALDRAVAALILESTFTSVRPFAARLLAPGFMVRDPFDTLAALHSYRGPLLVIHGEQDEVIPVAHGRALAAAVEGAEFLGLPCGHNDCPRVWEFVHGFLAGHGLISSAQPAAGGAVTPRLPSIR